MPTGTINIRLNKATHRKLKIFAAKKSTDLSGAIEQLFDYAKSK